MTISPRNRSRRTSRPRTSKITIGARIKTLLIQETICRKFPELKITLEHITTDDAVEYVKEGNINLSATIKTISGTNLNDGTGTGSDTPFVVKESESVSLNEINFSNNDVEKASKHIKQAIKIDRNEKRYRKFHHQIRSVILNRMASNDQE